MMIYLWDEITGWLRYYRREARGWRDMATYRDIFPDGDTAFFSAIDGRGRYTGASE